VPVTGEYEQAIAVAGIAEAGQRHGEAAFDAAAAERVLKSDACKGIKVLDAQTANWMRTPAMDLMANWITSGLAMGPISLPTKAFSSFISASLALTPAFRVT